jgi:Type I phosphodiesterase / nucleotide pyrophosphatase
VHTPALRNQRLILLEFNELCPHLVDRFIDEGALPNFKRLREASETFITHTNEEVLEPWIQWVTVHTGVPFSEHGIKDLDEAEKVTHDTFWDDLAEENVLLMSPMNVKFRRRNQSLFMPDPWAASQVPSAELEPFYNFIRAAVNSHARTDRLDLKVAAKAVRFLLAHGLKLNTLTAAFNQLFVERFGRRDAKWRRATILDRLLWDVFAYFWRGPRQPRVGIFFSNATAHYQHKYWSHHDPAQFSLKPDADEVETYGNVIRFGYQAHDRLIGKAMALAEAGTAIALCTALSQQPMRDYEVRGGKHMFLAKDFAALQTALGIPATGRAEALMAEESWMHFATEADGADGYRKFSSAKTGDGRALFRLRGFDGKSFIIGCGVFASEVDVRTTIVNAAGASMPFHEHFLQMETVTTAKHHPDGIFWIMSGHPSRRAPKTGFADTLPLTHVRGKLEQALAFQA